MTFRDKKAAVEEGKSPIEMWLLANRISSSYRAFRMCVILVSSKTPQISSCMQASSCHIARCLAS